MMTKEGSTKILTFMTPGAGVLVLVYGHISHIVKIHFFLKSFSLFPVRDQTNYVYTCVLLMTRERSTKIVNFMTRALSWGSDVRA